MDYAVKALAAELRAFKAEIEPHLPELMQILLERREAKLAPSSSADKAVSAPVASTGKPDKAS